MVHDEMAYLLQAEIFARGRWALASPPMPEFWEQPHVLVVPMLAAKYFPGHSLVLAVGALLGWPPLMPLVLQATSAVLLFVLGRRLANGGVALLAWVIWLTTPMVLYLGPSYFSEGTTTVCWLAGWFTLLRWREARDALAPRRGILHWMGGDNAAAHWSGVCDPHRYRCPSRRRAVPAREGPRPRVRAR